MRGHFWADVKITPLDSIGTFRKLLRERRRGRERGFSTFCFHTDAEAIFVFSQHDVNFSRFRGIWV